MVVADTADVEGLRPKPIPLFWRVGLVHSATEPVLVPPCEFVFYIPYNRSNTGLVAAASNPVLLTDGRYHICPCHLGSPVVMVTRNDP